MVDNYTCHFLGAKGVQGLQEPGHNPPALIGRWSHLPMETRAQRLGTSHSQAAAESGFRAPIFPQRGRREKPLL